MTSSVVEHPHPFPVDPELRPVLRVTRSDATDPLHLQQEVELRSHSGRADERTHVEQERHHCFALNAPTPSLPGVRRLEAHRTDAARPHAVEGVQDLAVGVGDADGGAHVALTAAVRDGGGPLALEDPSYPGQVNVWPCWTVGDPSRLLGFAELSPSGSMLRQPLPMASATVPLPGPVHIGVCLVEGVAAAAGRRNGPWHSEILPLFLADIVLPNGSTVGEWAAPQLEAAYASGEMPALMPGGGHG